MANLLGWILPVPSFYSIRLWVLRIGLYRLLSAPLGPRWALICDHTATYAGVKLFVICGVDLDELDQRIADGTGNFSLSQRDVVPLAIVPMAHSNAQILLEQYKKCIGQRGHPERMITDGGSDIIKSARLLGDYQKADGLPPTKHTYDISHQIARIVEHELDASPEWKSLEAMVSKARVYCKYRARHLSPPTLSHGPDRWMNLGGIIQWIAMMLELLLPQKAPDARGDTPPACQVQKAVLQPRFGLTRDIWEVGKTAHHQRDGVFYALADLCGKEYRELAAYESALIRQSSKIPAEVKTYLLENSNLNEIYLNDIMGGTEKNEGIHREVVGMLAFTNRVQKYLKENGLTPSGVKKCEDFYAAEKLEGVGRRVGEKVLLAVKQMALELQSGERILVTSDVIESLNGSWKMHINATPTPALGSNALLMPGLMWEPSAAEIKSALENVSVADVEDWRNQNFGQTFYQAKRVIRLRKTSPKLCILLS